MKTALLISRLAHIKNKTECLDNSTVGNNKYENGVLVSGVTWYNEPINFDNVLIGYVALFQVARILRTESAPKLEPLELRADLNH